MASQKRATPPGNSTMWTASNAILPNLRRPQHEISFTEFWIRSITSPITLCQPTTERSSPLFVTTRAPQVKKQILLIEDEEHMLRLLQFALKTVSASIHCVKRGAAAVDFLKANKPNLVLLDYAMPG